MASRKNQPRRQEESPAVRFEATLGPATHAKALAVAADLAIDRLPDLKRKVRLLITADDARRLLERGYEVHLQAAVPVAPLNRKLIMTNRQSDAWLAARLKGIPRKGRK